MSDDEMVGHLEFHQSRCFHDLFGKPQVSLARGRIAGGMIVNNGKVRALVEENRTQHVTHDSQSLITTSRGHFMDLLATQTGVQGKYPQRFNLERLHLWRHEAINLIRVGELDPIKVPAAKPSPQLEGGSELAGFGRSKTMFLG